MSLDISAPLTISPYISERQTKFLSNYFAKLQFRKAVTDTRIAHIIVYNILVGIKDNLGRSKPWSKTMFFSRNVRNRTFGYVHQTKIQISLRIRAVWLKSSMGAFWIAKDAKFLHADNEDSDQTARMRRLI